MQVAVCVITYQRPEGLARLLDGLNRLAFAGDPPGVRCIVVDNDEAESAREVCERARPGFRWELEYHVEPRRGIPFARNRAVECAGEDIDFIAFIDDDEEPISPWLDALLSVQASYDADVVTGAVVRRFVGKTPAWIAGSTMLQVGRHPTGRRLTQAGTGNVLVRARVFRKMDTYFDERTPFTGGTDMHFFRRVHLAGFSIVWANEAVVHEWMPSTRATAGWVLQRAYRVGNSRTLVELDLDGSLRLRVALLLQVLWSLFKGAVLFPLGFVRGKRGFVRSFWHFCHVAGTIAAFIGFRYEEYRRTHGN